MSDQIFIGIDDERIEATGEQLAYILKAQAEAQAADEAAKAAEIQRQEARAAILAKLGLTEEEARVLLG